MNKKLLALKILLPVLIVLLVALLTLQIKSWDFHGDNENGLLFVIALFLNSIPMIAMIVLGLSLIIDSILLFVVKKKISVIISALIFLCILVPFVAFSVFVDFTALRIFIEVPIIAVVVLAVNVAAIVVCCMLISENKKRKKLLSNG